MMTPEEFKEAMKKFSQNPDTEAAHTEADRLMCKLLTDLGYGNGVKVFKSMQKWYA